MPELPEVEVIRRGLAPRIVGRRVMKVARGDKLLRRQSPPAELRHWLRGRLITDLQRRGKYLIFDLEDGVRLLVHLGMTGRLLLGPAPFPALPHVHLVLHLEGGLELGFQDVRRFGQVLVFPPGTPLTPLDQVGQEPFSPRVTAAWLADQARGRQRPTTFSDFLNSRGETGLFQVELQVYGRGGEPCLRCGAPLQRLVQAGRSTCFCPACQKLKP
jgi:formamidopyrimidine-DNA glycosylase